MRATRGRALTAAALLPAVVFLGVVLLQGGELVVPAAHSKRCAATARGRSGRSGETVGASAGGSGAAASVSAPAQASGTPTRACATAALATVTSERRTALDYGWAGAGLTLVLGLGVVALFARRSGGAGVDRESERQRAALVRACVNVSDAVGSGALREQLVDALGEAGVTPIEVPAGERFDASRHRAVGQVRTSDRANHHTVAKTERMGYLDRGRRLRYPDVIVFDAGEGSTP